MLNTTPSTASPLWPTWTSTPPLTSIDLSPSPAQAWKPFYHHPHNSIFPFVSDKFLALLAPIAVYWLASLWFQTLDVLRIPFFEKYRLHEPEEIQKRNKVSATRVIIMVVLQQVVQTILGLLVLENEETVRQQIFQDHGENMRRLGVHFSRFVCGTVGYKAGLPMLERFGTAALQWLYWWGIPFVQYWWAFFVMDAWQYALHRAFHESRFLYRHFHSHHHRLYVPYSFGALYNHPLEGLLLDSAGGAISHALALMTVRQGILLFTFSTFKTVCDHGGYAFPWYLDPLHLFFPNCAEYHDVHHQMLGLRYNYSQPFFVHFDVVFGTRISSEKFDKMRQLNKRLREKDKVDKLVAPSVSAAKNATSTAVKSASSNGRQRPMPSKKATHSDLSPQDIVSADEDPLVTTSLESYRAKAGTTLSAAP